MVDVDSDVLFLSKLTIKLSGPNNSTAVNSWMHFITLHSLRLRQMKMKQLIKTEKTNEFQVLRTRSATEGSNPRMNRRLLTENHKLYTEERRWRLEIMTLKMISKWPANCLVNNIYLNCGGELTGKHVDQRWVVHQSVLFPSLWRGFSWSKETFC